MIDMLLDTNCFMQYRKEVGMYLRKMYPETMICISASTMLELLNLKRSGKFSVKDFNDVAINGKFRIAYKNNVLSGKDIKEAIDSFSTNGYEIFERDYLYSLKNFTVGINRIIIHWLIGKLREKNNVLYNNFIDYVYKEQMDFFEVFHSRMLKESFDNYLNAKNDCKIFLKNSIISHLAIFYSLTNEHYNQKKSNELYKKLKKEYKNFSISQILKKNNLNRNNIHLPIIKIADTPTSSLESIYFTYIAKSIISNGKSFDINDVVDCSNFLIAYSHNHPYLTLDLNSLEKYLDAFKEYTSVINYVEKCIKMTRDFKTLLKCGALLKI
ncbi:MAG: hypothetical protein IJR67_03035 [Acholeplasmatales bacterium]|nr:hypothetical protein [Acholeplasmatales bacterium]